MLPPDAVIEAVALNGFIAQLPTDLLLNADENKAVAAIFVCAQAATRDFKVDTKNAA